MINQSYVHSSAKIIKRVPDSPDARYGCTVVDNVPVNKPAIIVFGGDLTQTDKNANSYAKQMQYLLTENSISGIDVYSIIYNFGSMNPGLERAEQFRIAGRRADKIGIQHPISQYEQHRILENMRKNEPISNYVQQLFNILLRPRISTSKGFRLPINQAIKYIKSIKFYAHCQGASTIWQMANYMYDEMLRLGYSKNDTTQIQRELLVIQHSPVAPLTKQKFTTISFASGEDSMMQHHNNIFADWIYDNSADLPPCYFGPEYGNLFIGGRLQEFPFKEHDNRGLLIAEKIAYPLTPDGEVIFTAERNALLRAAKCAISGRSSISVKKLTDGNGADFDTLKSNGKTMYTIMLHDLHQRNLKLGYQK